MLRTHQRKLRLRLPKIVEIETLWLPLFIVGDDQVSGRRGLGRSFSFTGLLALCLPLLFFNSFIEPSAFFLTFREAGTRVSCHIN